MINIEEASDLIVSEKRRILFKMLKKGHKNKYSLA
jgi:hypothetical protein